MIASRSSGDQGSLALNDLVATRFAAAQTPTLSETCTLTAVAFLWPGWRRATSRYNITPRSNVPVIRRERGELVVRVMVRPALSHPAQRPSRPRCKMVGLADTFASGSSLQNWSVVPHWTKHEQGFGERLKTINARSESIQCGLSIPS